MSSGYLSEAFVSFQGEGVHVGRRHLFLRFAGCPLRCRYCDTPESLVKTSNFVVRGRTERRLSNPLSVADVLRVGRELVDEAGGAVDGVSLTGGEPLSQSRFLAELLAEWDLGLPALLETSGTMPDRLEGVVDRLDVVSMDVKLPSNTGETPFWNEHREFLGLVAGKVYVKVLVDQDTSDSDVQRAAILVHDVAPSTPLFLQPITGGDGAVSISQARLGTLFDISRAIIADVRVLPQVHKFLKIP